MRHGIGVAAIALVVSGCQHAASNARAGSDVMPTAASAGASTSQSATGTAAPLRGTAIGDTATFHARIAALAKYPQQNSMVAFKTTFSISQPAHVIWIELIPGRAFALLSPTSGTLIAPTATGQHAADFSYSALPDYTSVTSKQDEYNRCMESADRQAREADRRRRATPPPKPTKVDRDGKPIEAYIPEPPAGGERDWGAYKRMESLCKAGGNGSKARAPAQARAERYLIMLASHVPLSAAQINQRLSALEVTASNVQGTVEALAQGIYLNHQAVWSGYYVAW